MHTTRFYIGVEKDKDNRTILAEQRTDNFQTMLARLSKEFGGVTLIPAMGGWLDSNGKLVTEQSWIVEILSDRPITPDRLVALRHWLIGLWNQSDVLAIAA